MTKWKDPIAEAKREGWNEAIEAPCVLLNRLPANRILEALGRKGYLVTEHGCWEFSGMIAPNGYGRIRVAGRTFPAHRAMYVATMGSVDPALVVRHQCDNRCCINPAHLRPGTQSQNMMDASRRKRLHAYVSPETMPRGSRHGRSKLNEDDVSFIRASKEKTRHLAKRFGVDRTTIIKARSGASWSHV